MKPIQAGGVTIVPDARSNLVALRLHDASGQVIAYALCTPDQARAVNGALGGAILSVAEPVQGVVH